MGVRIGSGLSDVSWNHLPVVTGSSNPSMKIHGFGPVGLDQRGLRGGSSTCMHVARGRRFFD